MAFYSSALAPTMHGHRTEAPGGLHFHGDVFVVGRQAA